MNAVLTALACLCGSGALAWTVAERRPFQWRVRDPAAQAPAPEFGRHIPYVSHVAAGVIKTRSGDYQSTWRLEGAPFEATEDTEIGAHHAAFNQLVRALSSRDVAIWSHRIRRPATVELEGSFPDRFSEELDAAYCASLGHRSLFSVELYMTVLYRAPKARRGSGSSQTLIELMKQDEARAVAVMHEIDQELAGAMKQHRPLLLTTVHRNGVMFSEALEFLGYLVNGCAEPVPVLSGAIHQALATTRLSAHRGYVTLEGAGTTRYAALLDLKDYPQFTEPGQLNSVSYGDFSFTETQSFSVLPPREARGYLERQRSQLTASADVAVSQIVALDQALDQLVNGNFVLGEYHYSLAVFGKDAADAFSHLSKARAALTENGFQSTSVDLVADAAWFAQMPGNWRYRARLARLSSHNFCALSAPHVSAQGKSIGNPWGDAVSVLDTPSRIPYYFNFHQGVRGVDAFDEKVAGNTMIIGPTGAGKTVAQLFLLSQARRHHPSIVFFDKDRGAEIALRAMGGHYLVLAYGEPSGLNPFQWQTVSYHDIFCETLVRMLIESSGPPLTTQEIRDIGLAVRQVLGFPVNLRRLSTLRQNLPSSQLGDLRARLSRWCDEGSMAWLFDNPTDSLSLVPGGILGIDTTSFLDRPEARAPLMHVLLSWVRTQQTGQRFIYVMAEFWKSLENPVFIDFVQNQQKTIRKANGIGIFDTQSAADVLSSPIARTLIEQTATFLFFPNPRADRTDYMEGFKCTEIEFTMIRDLPAAARTFLVKQGTESMLVRLDLTGLPEYIDVLSGTTENVALLDTLRETFGDLPERWLPAYHRELERRRSCARDHPKEAV